MDKIPRIDIGDARIERIPAPIIERLSPPVVNGLEYPTLRIPRPVVDLPSVRIDYPTLPATPLPAPSFPTKPTQPQQPQSESKPERKLPVSPPAPPVPKVTVVQPPVTSAPSDTTVESEAQSYVMTIAGHEVNVPTPKEVVQASVTAVLGTTATLATAMIFNQARRVIGEAITKAKRDKFKIKFRAVKPVIHMIQEDDGVTVMEYSAEGVRTLATHVHNPEQYLRDTIEADELYEADHKIVIDEPIREKFSREGSKRFNYFAPTKKLARRLSARLTWG